MNADKAEDIQNLCNRIITINKNFRDTALKETNGQKIRYDKEDKDYNTFIKNRYPAGFFNTAGRKKVYEPPLTPPPPPIEGNQTTFYFFMLGSMTYGQAPTDPPPPEPQHYLTYSLIDSLPEAVWKVYYEEDQNYISGRPVKNIQNLIDIHNAVMDMIEMYPVKYGFALDRQWGYVPDTVLGYLVAELGYHHLYYPQANVLNAGRCENDYISAAETGVNDLWLEQMHGLLNLLAGYEDDNGGSVTGYWYKSIYDETKRKDIAELMSLTSTASNNDVDEDCKWIWRWRDCLLDIIMSEDFRIRYNWDGKQEIKGQNGMDGTTHRVDPEQPETGVDRSWFSLKTSYGTAHQPYQMTLAPETKVIFEDIKENISDLPAVNYTYPMNINQVDSLRQEIENYTKPDAPDGGPFGVTYWSFSGEEAAGLIGGAPEGTRANWPLIPSQPHHEYPPPHTKEQTVETGLFSSEPGWYQWMSYVAYFPMQPVEVHLSGKWDIIYLWGSVDGAGSEIINSRQGDHAVVWMKPTANKDHYDGNGKRLPGYTEEGFESEKTLLEDQSGKWVTVNFDDAEEFNRGENGSDIYRYLLPGNNMPRLKHKVEYVLLWRD